MRQVFEAEFGLLPFKARLIAMGVEEACRIAIQWYEARARRDCPRIGLSLCDDDLWTEDTELFNLLQLGVSGIIAWQPEAGWLVLPPDMEAQGLLHRSSERVRCFKVNCLANDNEILVCAPHPDKAVEIYSQWCEVRGLVSEGLQQAAEFELSDVEKVWPGLIRLMALGAVGVVSIVHDHIQVLLPWDDAAGLL